MGKINFCSNAAVTVLFTKGFYMGGILKETVSEYFCKLNLEYFYNLFVIY